MKIRNNKSRQLKRQFQKYIFGAAPYRNPIIASGRGSFFVDVDGNKYLDLSSGQFCLALGYGNKAFEKAVTQQLKKIIHTNTLYLSEPVLEAFQALAAILPEKINKSILLSTGSEAVEFALRNAKFYSGKEGVVALDHGYHGLTLAAQSITSGGKYARPKVPKTFSIPVPDYLNYSGELTESMFIREHLQRAEKQLRNQKGQIAAFVIEPILSAGGMIFPAKEYFQGLAKLAKSHKALLIVDESQTGLGRTGRWFAFEHLGIIPDMIVTAKAAGLGLPVAIVAMKDKIADALEGKLMHFSSHQNDPIQGAVLNFVIKYFIAHKFLNKIRHQGDYFLRQLQQLSEKQLGLINPRGLGLMLAFDLRLSNDADYRQSYYSPGQKLISILERKGIAIQAINRGRTFRILPSYTIAKSEIDLFVKKLKEALHEL